MATLYTSLLGGAFQYAAWAHRNQLRKGSQQPYISHPMMVALLVQRAGFDEETVAAAVLHDVVEDTDTTLEQIATKFGPRVAALVDLLSEKKLDASGRPRSWELRKLEKFETIRAAPVEAKALALADKLHNLHSVLEDLQAGRPIWERFNGPRDRWLWNAERVIEACDGGDPRLRALAAECRDVLEAVRRVGQATASESR